MEIVKCESHVKLGKLKHGKLYGIPFPASTILSSSDLTCWTLWLARLSRMKRTGRWVHTIFHSLNHKHHERVWDPFTLTDNSFPASTVLMAFQAASSTSAIQRSDSTYTPTRQPPIRLSHPPPCKPGKTSEPRAS